MHKKKKTRSGSAGMIAFLVLAALSALLFGLNGEKSEVLMLGDEEMNVEYGSEFVDPCVEIVRTGKVFKFMNETELVPAVEQMTTDTLGKFKIHYLVVNDGEEQRFERIVNVVDTTPPAITVTDPEGTEGGSWMNGFSEPEISAYDLVDGDLSDAVQITHLDGKVIYSVADAQGNEAVLERTPPQGSVAPEIMLTGGSDYTFTAAMDWVEPGYSVIDSDGTDLSELVQVSGYVTPYKLGDYTLSYQLSNSRGDTLRASRTVHVVAAERKEAVIPEQKTIYLTFDDGPGPYTDQLLDLLAKYDVKATFFVTGNYPDYYDCIGRAYDEGHTIAVHTFCHDYRQIYRGVQAYFDDFKACEDLIYEQTGALPLPRRQLQHRQQLQPRHHGHARDLYARHGLLLLRLERLQRRRQARADPDLRGLPQRHQRLRPVRHQRRAAARRQGLQRGGGGGYHQTGPGKRLSVPAPAGGFLRRQAQNLQLN